MHKKYYYTKFISINTELCKACWKCFESCPKKVIGKISVFFHKHAKLSNPDKCTGCLKCLNTCEYKAIISLKPAGIKVMHHA